MGKTGFLNKVGMERMENDQSHGGHWEKEECMIHDMTRCIRLGEGKKKKINALALYIYRYYKCSLPFVPYECAG